ncbi:heparan-alpha-glucosaminide N-acetyltransferase-like, partial [Thalictrum thalictroides]
MADYVQLRNEVELEEEHESIKKKKTVRLASLDVFRGLSVFLMIFVDYAGAILPSISHSPWNGVRLADFVMPFFLFIVGVSLALVYKNVQNKMKATFKAVIRATQLFLLGIFLQ